MSKPFIVLGDKTDHGGTVISASLFSDIGGKGIARIGDNVVCPRCRGTFPITTGQPDMIIDGQPAAAHGDKTACGATLLATQFTTTLDHGSVGGAAAAETQPALTDATQTVAAEAPTICLDCLMKAAANGSGMVVRG
jgi:uncharacterized Zn-binding protein involved in type VI secretion